MPVLVVAGERDDPIGEPAALAQAIPGARLERPSGRDHLTAVADPAFRRAVLDFLAR